MNDPKARALCGPALLTMLAVLVGVVPSWADAAAEDANLPWELRDELTTVLKKKSDEIFQQKNEAGRRFQRAGYAKRFKTTGDGYQVAFIKDSVTEDRMRTDRYLLTLSQEGGKWQVTGEEHQDSYEKLIREVPGDEKFFSFDKFTFDREGLRVTATNGYLVQDSLMGEPYGMIVTATDLSYEYAPPVNLGYHQNQLYARMQEERKEDFVFDPEAVWVRCNPEACNDFVAAAFTGLAETTVDAVDSELQKLYRESTREEKEARRERPFSGFRLPPRKGHENWNVAVKRQGRDDYVGLGFDNEAAWEVSFWASDYGRLYGYPSQATLASGVQPHEIERRVDYSARRYSVESVDARIEVALEEAELLRADVTFGIKIHEKTRELPFYLADDSDSQSKKRANLTLNDLEDGEGRPMIYVRRGASGGLIVFPEELEAGAEITLTMDYETRGSIHKESSSYAYVQRGGWLPLVKYEEKVPTFNLTILSPSKYETIGVGRLVEKKTSGDVLTTRWEAQGVHFPTVIFGVYREGKPKTVAEKFDGTKIPVVMHCDKDSMSSWNVTPKSLTNLAEQAINALNIYRELYGVDYPHDKLDLVNDPTAFIAAQAPDSIVYVGIGVFRGEAWLAENLVDAGRITRRLDTLVAHEVAHQWWGGLVGPVNMQNYWFVESLAEYSAALFYEIIASDGFQNVKKGQKAYLNYIAGWRKEILETDLLSSVQDARVAWAGNDGFGSYTTAVYAKGPYAFHILRTTFGDEQFFAFLKKLGTELSGKQIVTRDIQRIAEESFGGTMEWFFDQWIRGVGIPEYSFTYDSRQAEDGGYIIQGKIKQRVVAGLKKYELDGVFYRGRVPVTVLGSDRQRYVKSVIVEGAETAFALKVPVKPTEILFNQDGQILSHPVLENQGW